jgi:hypothetical protein
MAGFGALLPLMHRSVCQATRELDRADIQRLPAIGTRERQPFSSNGRRSGRAQIAVGVKAGARSLTLRLTALKTGGSRTD